MVIKYELKLAAFSLTLAFETMWWENLVVSNISK